MSSNEEQKLLITAMISSPIVFTRTQHMIHADYFERPLNKVVKFLLDYSDEYKALPNFEQIKAKTSVDLAPMAAATDQEVKFYLDEVEEFCKNKAMTKAILESVDLIGKGEYGSVEKKIKDALSVGLTKSIGTEYFDDPKARLQHLLDANGKLSTGWAAVDQKLYNVGPGELLIFAAPSGGGKSVGLQNLCVNMALQVKNVIYITYELSEELCAKRMDSMMTGVAQADIFKKLDDVELLIRGAKKRCGSITVKQFKIGTNCLALNAYLKEYEIKKGYKPDAIMVDYLDLMAPNDGRINMSDLFIKDKFVSEELRNLAIENKMLVATASQFNRSAVNELNFDHSHIAGGLSKVQTADNVIAILNSQRARERGEIEFQYLKTRNSGGVGQKTILAYDVNTLRITDLLDTGSSQQPTSDSLNRLISRKNINTETQAAVEKKAAEKDTSGSVKDIIQQSRTDTIQKRNDITSQKQQLRDLLKKK